MMMWPMVEAYVGQTLPCGEMLSTFWTEHHCERAQDWLRTILGSTFDRPKGAERCALAAHTD